MSQFICVHVVVVKLKLGTDFTVTDFTVSSCSMVFQVPDSSRWGFTVGAIMNKINLIQNSTVTIKE